MQDEQIASSVDAPFIQFGGQKTNPSLYNNNYIIILRVIVLISI